MNKLFLVVLIAGAFTSSANAGVKKVYVGSKPNGVPYYVVECSNGNSYNSIHRENGYWHRGTVMSNMGDRYKNLSINEVAEKLCD